MGRRAETKVGHISIVPVHTRYVVVQGRSAAALGAVGRPSEILFFLRKKSTGKGLSRNSYERHTDGCFGLLRGWKLLTALGWAPSCSCVDKFGTHTRRCVSKRFACSNYLFSQEVRKKIDSRDARSRRAHGKTTWRARDTRRMYCPHPICTLEGVNLRLNLSQWDLQAVALSSRSSSNPVPDGKASLRRFLEQSVQVVKRRVIRGEPWRRRRLQRILRWRSERRGRQQRLVPIRVPEGDGQRVVRACDAL